MIAIPGFSRYKITEHGVIYFDGLYRGNNVLSTHISQDGYLKTHVRRQGKSLHASVHRLVAISYIPTTDMALEVNHIDGNKMNNHFSNLEWVTHHQNMTHANKLGLIERLKKGEHGMAKLILNTETGIFYETLIEAAESSGHNYKKAIFCMMMKGKRKNRTPFIYA